MKSKFYSEFSEIELLDGYNSMLRELDAINSKQVDCVVEVFNEAWTKFVNNEWSYDGASFVSERYKNTLFEVAAFIHDFRNSFGYVSYKIDMELINIMIILNYNFNLIISRYIMTRFTYINIIRHRFFLKKSKYKGSLLPKNIIKL